jgi:anti-sigma regulatory factor (Ser/Thr protein kinase)
VTLDQAFDAGTLHVLRKAVLAEAKAAGMPRDRAADVMIAVHELAANAVTHGAGTGRLRMRAVAGRLYCYVSDARPARAGDDARQGSADGQSWPVEVGHGLWLVRQVADVVSVINGRGGAEAMMVFTIRGSRVGDHG